MSKLGQTVLTVAAGIFFFFLFLLLLFPFDAVFRHFISQIEEKSAGNYRLVVQEIKPSLVFKTVFKGVQFYHKKETTEELWFDLKEVRLGIRYLPLLAGTLKSSFVAKAEQGKMEGDFSFSLSGSEYEIRSKLADINISDFNYVSIKSGIRLNGILNGNMNLLIDPVRVNRNEGTIDVTFKNLVIPAGRVVPYPNFDLDLPETILAGGENGTLKLKMEGGKMEIEQIRFPGEDLVLNLKGKVQFNKKISLSRVNGEGDFKLSQKLTDALPFLVVIDKQKNEEGFYPLMISGRLSKPRVQIGTFEAL